MTAYKLAPGAALSVAALDAVTRLRAIHRAAEPGEWSAVSHTEEHPGADCYVMAAPSETWPEGTGITGYDGEIATTDAIAIAVGHNALDALLDVAWQSANLLATCAGCGGSGQTGAHACLRCGPTREALAAFVRAVPDSWSPPELAAHIRALVDGADADATPDAVLARVKALVLSRKSLT